MGITIEELGETQNGHEPLFHGVDTSEKCPIDTTDIGRGLQHIVRLDQRNVLDLIHQ